MKESLIKKIYRDVLLVQILGLISSYISYMVDSAVIGRFLGDAALSAAGFINPVVSMCFALTGLFSTGIGVKIAALFCSGDIKETRKQFTKYFLSGLAAVAMISFLWIALAKPFAEFLGASSASEEIFDMTVSYLRIYLLANPIWFMLNVSIGVLELDGDKKLVLIANIAVLMINSTLDILNALWLHWGMAGMAAATVIAAAVETMIVMVHYLRRRSMIRFTSDFNFAHCFDHIGIGAIFSFRMICVTAFGIIMNSFLMRTENGVSAVAAFAAVIAISNLIETASNASESAVMIVASSMMGEEDANGLVTLFQTSLLSAVKLYIPIVLFVELAAPALLPLIVREEGLTLQMAVRGLRLYALGYILANACAILRSFYQVLSRKTWALILIILCDLACGVLVAGALLGKIGESAVWIARPCGILFGLVLLFILISLAKRKRLCGLRDILMLDGLFSDIRGSIEMTARTMAEVIDASRQVHEFVFQSTGDHRKAFVSALAVEEMAGNIIRHGFSTKMNLIVVRVVHTDSGVVLRVQDNCVAFSPKDFVLMLDPVQKTSHIGIRMINDLAEDMSYINSFNTNNLIIRF